MPETAEETRQRILAFLSERSFSLTVEGEDGPAAIFRPPDEVAFIIVHPLGFEEGELRVRGDELSVTEGFEDELKNAQESERAFLLFMARCIDPRFLLSNFIAATVEKIDDEDGFYALKGFVLSPPPRGADYRLKFFAELKIAPSGIPFSITIPMNLFSPDDPNPHTLFFSFSE